MAGGVGSWQHRPDLDGLRGIAVLLVILGHSGIPGFVGGARGGLHVFFVLSGYLITSLLVHEYRRAGRIDLRAFYVRRIRRLVPALITMVGIVTIVAYLAGTNYSTAALVSLAYVGNVFTGCEVTGPFCHTWTLATEEQFYLVWPVLVILGTRRRAFGIVAAIIAFALALTLPGFWAIGIGCIAAFLPTVRWTGIVGLVVLALYLPVNPGNADLAIISIATAGIILDRGITSRNLAVRPLVFAGQVSYGAYLWHFPISWVVASSVSTLVLAATLTVVLSMLAGWLSKVVVEDRLRRPFNRRVETRRADQPVEPQPRQASAGAADVNRGVGVRT